MSYEVILLTIHRQTVKMVKQSGKNFAEFKVVKMCLLLFLRNVFLFYKKYQVKKLYYVVTTIISNYNKSKHF